jgi:hypothetical protein
MINNPNEKLITTLKINKTLVDICETKEIKISELIRQTFQFLYVLHHENEDEMYDMIKEIINYYDVYENQPFQDDAKVIKTHITLKQQDAYQTIPQDNRVYFFNKLISVIINNTEYSNRRVDVKIKSDPIISEVSVNFFLNRHYDSEQLIYIIEALIAKTNQVLKYGYVSNSFYYNLYSQVFGEKIAKEWISNYMLAKFLLNEFKKIYFCMIINFNIAVNTKSSKGMARQVKKTYNSIYKAKYNKNIKLFMQNEIQVDTSESKQELFLIFKDFMLNYFPSEREQTIVLVALIHNRLFNV